MTATLLDELEFDVPIDLIAKYPLESRDQSKLLIINGKQLEETKFNELTSQFKAGDVLVLNNSKVIKSRLITSHNGKQYEIFLHRNCGDGSWKAFLKPGKKAIVGQVFDFGGNRLEVVEKQEAGDFVVKIDLRSSKSIYDFFEEFGSLPIPPYLSRKAESLDEQRYQTVIAAAKGSVAAPTAALHFTEELLDKVRQIGVKVVYLTLHVGAGTFLPIKGSIEEHVMHEEEYEISQESAETITAAKEQGNRVIAVGTTVLRALESLYLKQGKLTAYQGATDLFIKPGFHFNVVDMLLTNFHLPKSTLLLLVWAFGGKENMKKAYEHAIQNKFRLFSYGDTSLIYRNEVNV